MGFRFFNTLLIAAILLILLSVFIAENKTLDLHLSDTYLVLAGVHILRTLALFLILVWLLYRFTTNMLFSAILARLHIAITLIATTCITFALFYHAAQTKGAIEITRFRLVFPVFIVGVLLSQLLYVINLMLGVLKRVN